MGRIPKSKIDQIQELLKRGYLHKEVAKEVGVNDRTVSKYDPNRKSRKDKGSSMKDEQEKMIELLRTMLDWLNIGHYKDPLTVDSIDCPRCGSDSLRWTEHECCQSAKWDTF